MVGRRYDASEETLFTPVSPEEVDAYLQRKGRPVSGRAALQHFLYRVRVTISTIESDNKSLRRAVEKASETKRRVGTPTTLSPMDAVRYASPDEIAQIVGHLNAAQLNALAEHVKAARGLREALAADLHKVRSAAQEIGARVDLPAAVRAEFIRLVNTLPSDPGAVPTPKPLELARMAGLVEVSDSPAGAAPDIPELPSGTGGAPAAGHPAGQPDGDELTHRRVASLPQYGPTPAWTPDSFHVAPSPHTAGTEHAP